MAQEVDASVDPEGAIERGVRFVLRLVGEVPTTALGIPAPLDYLPCIDQAATFGASHVHGSIVPPTDASSGTRHAAVFNSADGWEP